MRAPFRSITILMSFAALLFVNTTSNAEQQEEDSPAVRIIVLGDSITKGVRTGVTADQIYAHLVEQEWTGNDQAVEVLNEGIGGERTDQSLKRLQKSVIARKPDIVTVMYGTNDSYVDLGKTNSRLTVEQYQTNLTTIVRQLQEADIQVVLMTEPRWGSKARNGIGESPNVQLAKFVQACRDVAKETQVPLVDHYAIWKQAEEEGANLSEWTTDECHPNPAGHEQLAQGMLPVLRPIVNKLRSAERAPAE